MANALFVQATPQSAARDGVLFAASSRLDNRSEVATAAGLGGDASEAECIQRTFEARGDAGIAKLQGAFAFAHWDAGTAELTLARDCLGFHPLFYHSGNGFAVFASNLADLLALPDVPRELDERMLANFLALNHREAETTFYRGVSRVPSRSVVRLSMAGMEQRRYWAPALDAPPPYRRAEDYIARARELFERATARALRDTPRVAMQVSGGLDSSAMAATAARLGLSEVFCYTGLPPEELRRPARAGWYLSERSKVEALAKMHPQLRVNFVTPRGAHPHQSDPALLFSEIPYAQRNTCNLGWFAHIADAIAADGHKVVMHGAMGNMTTSWDGHLSLAELLGQGRWLDALTEAGFIARGDNRSRLRVLASEGVMPLLPPMVQRLAMKMRGMKPEDASGHSLLRDDIIEELDLRRQWHAQGHDPSYRVRGSSAALRAFMIFDNGQIGRDTVGMYNVDGVRDIRSPFDDRDFIEFCLLVPETLFRRHGVKRWFARQVFADRLPQEILTETKSGEQAPNWFEMLDARKSIIAEQVERLQASHLASRLIDLPRAARLLAEWPKDAAEAQARMKEYRYGLDRAVHVGQFIRWVEGGNA
jgi:asparagine synthase (glutamine-hydrolysing)